MPRAPGLSVRLKLTISYAGFLMVAGSLLLAAAWFAGQRQPILDLMTDLIPEWAIKATGTVVPGNTNLFLRAFLPPAAIAMVFLLAFGLVGGWVLAGRMLTPLSRITDAARTASAGSLSHRIRLAGRNDEFRELADSFDTMLARLEAQVAEQQRFAANASHELRTPLAITRTMLEVARSDPTCDVEQLHQRLETVIERAIELTEAMLVLSQADQRSFTPEPVDLSLISEEVSETLLPLAEKYHVTLETSGEIALASGSPALLLQLVMNLVHNAIVHNLPTHGTVNVSTRVWSDRVMLTVKNTGEQLTPAMVATFVKPFQRGTERIHTDNAGVGLGLAIANSIAHAHNGTLSLTAQPAGGLCAVVTLPRTHSAVPR